MVREACMPHEYANNERIPNVPISLYTHRMEIVMFVVETLAMLTKNLNRDRAY